MEMRMLSEDAGLGVEWHSFAGCWMPSGRPCGCVVETLKWYVCLLGAWFCLLLIGWIVASGAEVAGLLR